MEELVHTLSGLFAKNNLLICEVSEVKDLYCKAKRIDNGFEISDIRLHADDKEEGLWLTPKEGSYIIICPVGGSKEDYMIMQSSALEEVKLYIDEVKLEMKESGLSLKREDVEFDMQESGFRIKKGNVEFDMKESGFSLKKEGVEFGMKDSGFRIKKESVELKKILNDILDLISKIVVAQGTGPDIPTAQIIKQEVENLFY